MILSTLCLAAVGLLGQQAGPSGSSAPGAPAEIKTLADLYARNEVVPVPQYMKRVVMVTYRSPDDMGVSRLETLVGPERVRFKMADLNGLNIVMCGTVDEIWVLNNTAKEFFRVPLKGQPVTTEVLYTAIFGELNKGALAKQNDDDPIGLKLRFGPSGMPTVSFPFELKLHEKKSAGEGEEYLFTAQVKKNDVAATVTTDKVGRVMKAAFDFVVEEGYAASVTLETILLSTEVVAKSEFDYPEAAAKDYKKGQPGKGG